MVIPKSSLLVAFEKVCQLKTVHAAASDLKLTQAAITKRIQALERELGLSLFIRSRRGMTLTEEGAALLRYCRTTQEAEGELMSKLDGDRRQDVSLTIVGPTSMISTRIADQCIPLYAKFPFLRLHLKSEDRANLIEALRRGEADVAVVTPAEVPNEMHSKMLKPERFYLVAPAHWQGRDLRDIIAKERIVDFYDSDATTFDYLTRFGLEKHVARNRLFVNENEALVRYIQNGVGYGTLTESLAKPHVENGSLIRLNRAQSFEMPFALAWYARSKDMAHFQDLLKSVK